MIVADYGENLIRSITDHIDSYLSNISTSEVITLAATVKPKHNRIVSGTDIIAGFTRVSSSPSADQYSILYGAKANPSVLSFNSADIGRSKTLSYYYKPAIMLSWNDMLSGLENADRVKTPVMAVEIDSGGKSFSDQGMTVIEEPKRISVDAIFDTNDDGSCDILQRERVRAELSRAFRSNIVFYDYSVVPARTCGAIIVEDYEDVVVGDESDGKFKNRLGIVVDVLVPIPDFE